MMRPAHPEIPDERPPGPGGRTFADDTRSTDACAAALVAAALLLGASALATAHHGTNISYDRSKQFTAQAVVTEFEYRNPHPSCTSSSRTTRARR